VATTRKPKSPRSEERPDAQASSGAVGARIRELRRSHGVSARDLATRTGITPSYLSRLETGRINPTVGTLIRLVDALGEPLVAIFDDGGNGDRVVRQADRRVTRSRGTVDSLLTPSRDGRLEVLETIIEPGAGSGDAYNHWGEEECVVVLEGSLRIWVDSDAYDLEPGDSITFPCRALHSWHNGSDSSARVLWIITPGGLSLPRKFQ
jgi:transcriptional regulator with XRE-family HTH domain